MLSNVIQLVVVLVVFVLILIAAYFTTRFVGQSGSLQSSAKNIHVLETFKVTQNKYIQIITLGSRYYAIGISKDNITFLTELSEEQLDLSSEGTPAALPSFKSFFEKAKSGKKEK